MPAVSVRFPGSLGTELAARLDMPALPPRAYALFAHCFTCSKESKAASFVSAALAEHGVAVLRFDFTGLGASAGDFADTGFSSNVADLVAAADWLRANHGAPAILVGHSLGGAAVLAAASRIPECRAVATIGAPYEPAHVKGLLKSSVEEIVAKGEAEVDLGGRSFRIRREFLDDLDGQPQKDAIAGLRRALLVMHSPLDDTVPIDNATGIFVAAKHPKSFVSLDTADHLLTRREDARYAAAVLAAWADRFVPLADPHRIEGSAGEVVVAETREGKFTQAISAAGHSLRADEPQSLGGLGSAPGPYDLLLAGLGACTSMTIRMYADLKKLPLERVSVRLKHEKIHATDCADCETRDGRVDRIERIVTLEGDLDDAQRAKLLEIAEKCPVHRTLHAEVSIPTRLG
ncbi:MAG: alpha/beta fold hydrolase [Lysobacter sp.]|nr:alpha/beta fold hydrolase [Lysobacter sp.]